MSRIGYDDKNKHWISLTGPENEVHIPAPNDENEYYYVVQSRRAILRCYAHWCGWDEALGEVLTYSGDKVTDIPPFMHPSFRDMRKYYKSQIGWIQGECENGSVEFIVHCPNPQDFRIKLNLKTMEYAPPEFGVR